MRISYSSPNEYERVIERGRECVFLMVNANAQKFCLELFLPLASRSLWRMKISYSSPNEYERVRERSRTRPSNGKDVDDNIDVFILK